MKTKERIAALMMKYPLAIETINFPVRYDEQGQSVWDSENMMICDVRGWSRIQFKPLPERRQDEIGNLIADLLNEFSDLKATGKDQPEHNDQKNKLPLKEPDFY